MKTTSWIIGIVVIVIVVVGGLWYVATRESSEVINDEVPRLEDTQPLGTGADLPAVAPTGGQPVTAPTASPAAPAAVERTTLTAISPKKMSLR